MGDVLNCSSVENFYSSIFEIVNISRKKGIVFYGAGFWGEIAVRIFARFDVTPLVFCDDDVKKQGSCKKLKVSERIVSIPICSLEEAYERFPEAIYIVTVSNIGGEISPRYYMNQRLREKGVLSVYSGFHPNRYGFLLDINLGGYNTFFVQDDDIRTEDITGIVVMNHMGNSGSIYLNTIMDWHPSILNIVFLGGQARLEALYQKRLRFLKGLELAVEIMSQMQPYLESSIGYECYSPAEKIGEIYFLNADGNADRDIYISPNLFFQKLICALEDKNELSYGELLKVVYVAYANALGRKRSSSPYLLFYDMHNMNYENEEAQKWFSKEDFKNIYYLYIIREPVQQLYSFLKRSVVNANIDVRYFMMRYEFPKHFLSGTGTMLVHEEDNKENVRVIRFEDLKKDNRNTLEKLCDWLQIPYSVELEDTTVNGRKTYFPAMSVHKRPITGNDTQPVNNSEYTDLFNKHDIDRLRLFYKNMLEQFYKSDEQNDLAVENPKGSDLWDTPFLFEQVIDDMLTNDKSKRSYDYSAIQYKEVLRNPPFSFKAQQYYKSI